MPSTRTALAIVSLAIASVLTAGCSREPRERLVLVTIDTLRWDTFAGRPRATGLDKELDEAGPCFLSGEDAGLVTSLPETRNWALEGARFDRCYSVSPVTQPAHASLFTGLLPWQHGVTRNAQILDPACTTVAELLAARGWETAAVVASFPLTRRMGLAQGFGTYVDDLELRRDEPEWNGRRVGKFYTLSGTVTDRALAILDGLEGPRQFLWVHYFDPHAPYGDTDPDGLVRGLGELQKAVFNSTDIKIARARIVQARRLYEKDVRALDVQLSRLLSRLREDEDEYETHVVLVADHGESFGEDDSLGHGRRLTEAQLRVPLVIRSPRVPPGRRSEPVSSVDVAATLVSLAGANVRMPNGRDLTAELLGRELVAGMRTTFRGVLKDGRVTGGEQVLRGERWFVYEPWGLVCGDRDSAFLEDDETRTAPEDVARRSTELFAIFADELVGAAEIDDEETRAALEALGYAE